MAPARFARGIDQAVFKRSAIRSAALPAQGSSDVSSRMTWLLAAVLLGGAAAVAAQPADSLPLRFCADPGNMPLSDKQGDGFQNKVAEILARAMGKKLEYYWYSYYGRGLARATINADKCDVLMDVPSDYEMALVTKPYYKSTFVLTYRKDRGHRITSLDDPILKQWRIGVLQSSPAREALRMHGVFENTEVEYAFLDTGYSPDAGPAHQVQAVIDGKLDAAESWGPVAGYYVAKKHAPLAIMPLNTIEAGIPLEFAISFGVRRSDAELKQRLDAAFEQERDAIKAVLTAYGVPLLKCPECVISGDLPAHGPYTELEQQNIAARADHPVSSPEALAALKQRLAAGGDPNKELADAVIGNDPGRVDYLLAHGANPNEIAELEYNALQWAVREGHAAVARILLERGADVNARDGNGWTPLMLAVWRNDPAMVDLLIAQHANLDTYNSNGWSPLSVAITYGERERVRQLVDAGANVNAANDAGYTPLMFATAKSAPGVLALLIQRGANVGAANKAGITALMLAAAEGNTDAARQLLAAGADTAAKDAKGESALDVARSNGNAQIVALLTKRS